MTNFLPTNQLDSTVIASSAAVFGSLSIPSLTIDRQFGMEPGKLRNRAGIRSVSLAAPNETEVSLGMRAATGAFESAKIAPYVCDWVFASSETHHTFPSLAADLHASLRLPESCGALDIGGACLGLLHALATAQAFIASDRARRILVVTSDVHSRTLTSERVRGEFGGLFGDGATAFIVQDASQPTNDRVFGLGEFFFGCAAQFAKAIEIKDSVNGELNVVFDGDALSRAAITKMAQVISELERRSGDWSRYSRNRLASRPTVFRQLPRLTATSALRPAARHSTSCLSPLASSRDERICQFFSHRWDRACFSAEAGSLAGSLLPPDVNLQIG